MSAPVPIFRLIESAGTFNSDEESLKRFYLQDVLMHELGHHVDSPNFISKSDKKAEGFAEWFASEYGYRLARLRRRDE